MATYYQIPRNSLAWLLTAQAAVTLPLIGHLPYWVIALCVACVVWRVGVFRERLPFPSGLQRALFVVVGFVGVALTYRAYFSLQPMVALLTVAFYLKLLEMRRRRDAYVVVFLGYFVTAVDFLHDQSIPTTLYLLLCVVLTTTALIGLVQTQGHRRPLHSVTLAATLIAQALPLTLVAFLFFPRVPPLWSVPGDDSRATIGMSDSLSPGDFATLGRSFELAFRASFEGKIPPLSALYWRGLVFDHFDGQRWAPGDSPVALAEPVRWFGRPAAAWEQGVEVGAAPVHYEILLEPTRRSWLYSLSYPSVEAGGMGITYDFRLVSDRTLKQRHLYAVVSHLDFKVTQGLPDWLRERNLQLPKTGNGRARKLALQWKNASREDTDVVQKALRYYQRTFIYSLKPPKLGSHAIDEFLFDTQTGFCEHFASSFVFLMRAAGLPARVVVGYQGGEINPDRNYLLVHQYDAHAWAEVWLRRRGWVRVDPTAAVAPERIERGMAGIMADQEGFSGAALLGIRFDRLPLLGMLRLKLDWFSYSWTRWVVDYRADTQRDVIGSWLGGFDSERIAMALAVLSSLSIGFVALLVFRRSPVKQLDPAVRYYLRFCQKMDLVGLPRHSGETPAAFAARVARERPDLAEHVVRIQEQYDRLVYATNNPTESARGVFRREVDKFRPRKRPG